MMTLLKEDQMKKLFSMMLVGATVFSASMAMANLDANVGNSASHQEPAAPTKTCTRNQGGDRIMNRSEWIRPSNASESGRENTAVSRKANG
jgi:hypothetical protein